MTLPPPNRELPPLRVTSTPASTAATVRAVAKVAVRESAPVRESGPALRRPAPVEPAHKPPADDGVTEMTLADLVRMLDSRRKGAREIVLDDSTDQEELGDDRPVVLARGSQAGLAARMLRRP